jgi:dUTP pyrophosphatase
MKIKVKRLKESAMLPTRGSENAAGHDLYACIDKPIFVKPNETVMVGTGISMELPDGTFGAIFPRSGISAKRGLAPANKVGVCDSDYRGEYTVALHNHSDKTQWVNPGERIAQLIVMPYIDVNFNEVEKLSVTKRGDAGFGSTGK